MHSWNNQRVGGEFSRNRGLLSATARYLWDLPVGLCMWAPPPRDPAGDTKPAALHAIACKSPVKQVRSVAIATRPYGPKRTADIYRW